MRASTKGKPDAGAGKVVLLTGAANGIGRASAVALAARGFRLGLVDRDPDALSSAADEASRGETRVVARVADVCDGGALREAVREFEETLGPVDVLLPCAGVGGVTSVLDLDVDGFRRMLDVNVIGVARAIEAVLPGMFARKAGHVVGISSVAGFRGMPWMPGYSASKAALTTYLEALRPALKRRGVRVTTVYPGFVRTAMTRDTPFRDPVPMLEPDQAARHIVRAVLKAPRDYVFPLSTALGMGLLKRLPNGVYDRLMDSVGPRALTSEF